MRQKTKSKILSVLSNKQWLYAWLASLTLLISVAVYYYIQTPTETSFGERFVVNQIELSKNPVFIFKPITLMTILAVFSAVSFLEVVRRRVGLIKPDTIRLLIAVSFIFAVFVAYEVLWNFHAWFASWTKDGGRLDLLYARPYEYMADSNIDTNPVGNNFAYFTKVLTMLLGISIYVIYYLDGVLKKGVVRRFG